MIRLSILYYGLFLIFFAQKKLKEKEIANINQP